MNYGYFDEKNKEYVITRPDTPAPWANYLGSPAYGAIISNNAGGYSFVKSGANGRLIRYRFNAVEADQPGRYIYIKDRESGDFWSASWQPVGKELSQYESECHHGTAYTVINAKYDGIASEALYYVPLDKDYEVWRIKVTNTGTKPRKLSLFGYVEFTNEGSYEQDQVNLQYTLFITQTLFKGNKIVQVINPNGMPGGDGLPGNMRFFGQAGAKIDAYTGDREAFVGNYRSYANPIAVEQGCTNALNYNGNSCGALQSDLELAPGETREITYILGQHSEIDADAILAAYADKARVDTELTALKTYWHSKLNNLQIKTPDDGFNNMVNVWNAYQCFITFIWSRAASFQYCGLRNGYGYRDTVQDIQGIIHLAPELAYEQIKFMLSAQVDNGGGLPLVKYTHNAGKENTPDDPDYARETGHPSYRADDALWLFPTISKYIGETGNINFLDEVVSFANNGASGTVYEHLKRAIQFSMDHLGANGMPAGLHADWNDCLRMGKLGESTFVAFQLYYAIKILRGYAEGKGDTAYIAYLDSIYGKLHDALQGKCWEGDRYIRGIKEDGGIVGSKKDPEASMWLNPQSWSIISGCADAEQARLAMDNVYRELNTAHGAMLLYPPYQQHGFDGSLMVLFNPSTKENGGIFSQSQGWLILAETLLGNGDRAFEYFTEISPSSMNDKAEVRRLEPYVHGQFVESKDSPHAGRAHVHWLTGTASTVMVSCVEGILGIKPETNGLVVEPCIPAKWDGLEINKYFRGCKLHITVKNESHAQCGVKQVFLNGELLPTKFIPADKLKDTNEIIIVM